MSTPEQTEDRDEHQRRLEAQFAEIAALAGGLAHEIKNPLSTIRLNVELMSEELDCEKNPQDRRLVSRIERVQRECRHLESVLNEFLQFARVGELSTEELSLNEIVEEFIDFYQPQAQQKHLDISRHLAPDLPRVKVDRALLRQVLMNLALNAEQAMPEGGLLELQTFVRDGRVHLGLIDNGIGMDESTRSKIFQAFFSTNPQGSGLGLATVRRIVEAHHGSISCESEVGQGTRFTISLPIAGDGEGA